MRAVLTYHSIDDSGSPISVSPRVFAGHVAFLASKRVQVVHLEDLLALPPEVDAVAITFDDALTTVASIAAPLLAQHQLPATCFVVTGHAGGDNRWGQPTGDAVPRFAVLDWDALGKLAEQGVRLGAHSRHHRPLTGASKTELDDALLGAREDLETRTGARPRAFAYPYGAVDDAAALAVRTAYSVGCTTDHLPLPASPRPERLPRLDAWYFRAEGALEGWGRRRFLGKVLVRHALRTARRVLL